MEPRVFSGEPQRYRRCLPSLKIGIGSAVRERLLWSTTQPSFTLSRSASSAVVKNLVGEWRRSRFETLLTITHAFILSSGHQLGVARRSISCISFPEPHGHGSFSLQARRLAHSPTFVTRTLPSGSPRCRTGILQSPVAPPQHRLYFCPEPQGHSSFRLAFGAVR